MKFKKFLSIALSSLMVFQASFVCKANGDKDSPPVCAYFIPPYTYSKTGSIPFKHFLGTTNLISIDNSSFYRSIPDTKFPKLSKVDYCKEKTNYETVDNDVSRRLQDDSAPVVFFVNPNCKHSVTYLEKHFFKKYGEYIQPVAPKLLVIFGKRTALNNDNYQKDLIQMCHSGPKSGSSSLFLSKFICWNKYDTESSYFLSKEKQPDAFFVGDDPYDENYEPDKEDCSEITRLFERINKLSNPKQAPHNIDDNSPEKTRINDDLGNADDKAQNVQSNAPYTNKEKGAYGATAAVLIGTGLFAYKKLSPDIHIKRIREQCEKIRKYQQPNKKLN